MNDLFDEQIKKMLSFFYKFLICVILYSNYLLKKYHSLRRNWRNIKPWESIRKDRPQHIELLVPSKNLERAFVVNTLGSQ